MFIIVQYDGLCFIVIHKVRASCFNLILSTITSNTNIKTEGIAGGRIGSNMLEKF